MTPISRASAEQRAGRAGRTRPGRVRAAVERGGRSAPGRSRPSPEIRRVDLAGRRAATAVHGREPTCCVFPGWSRRRRRRWRRPWPCCARLGALEEHGVTGWAGPWPACRCIRGWPAADRGPALGRAGASGPGRGAALGARSVYARRSTADARRGACRRVPIVLDRVEALEEFERSGRSSTTPLGDAAPRARAVRYCCAPRDQLLRSTAPMARSMPPRIRDQPTADESGLLRALLAAFPDRAGPAARAGQPARRDGRRPRRAAGAVERRGRAGAVSLPRCGRRPTETLVRLASAVQRDWLPPEQMSTAIEVEFDADSERVTAQQRAAFCGPGAGGDASRACPTTRQTARVLAAAAAARLERVLPPDGFAGRAVPDARSLPAAMDAGAGLAGLRRRRPARIADLALPGLPFVCRPAQRRLAGGAAGQADARAAAGGGARGPGAAGSAERQPDRAALRGGPAAGAGGAHPGAVRPAGDAAHRRRAGARCCCTCWRRTIGRSK